MTTDTRPAFRLLGIDDEQTTCDQCGKSDLKCTMVLQPLDADGGAFGEPVRFGRDCGAAALGWKITAARAEQLGRGEGSLRPAERKAAFRAALNAPSTFGNKGHRDVARLVLDNGIAIEVVSLSCRGPGMFNVDGWTHLGSWVYWRLAAVP